MRPVQKCQIKKYKKNTYFKNLHAIRRCGVASCQTFNLNKAGYVWRLSMLDSLGAVPECGSYPTLFTSCPCVSSSDHRMCSNCKYFTLLRVKITCALWVWYVSCRRSPAFGLVLHRPWSELVDNTEYTVFGEEFRILLIVALVSGIWTATRVCRNAKGSGTYHSSVVCVCFTCWHPQCLDLTMRRVRAEFLGLKAMSLCCKARQPHKYLPYCCVWGFVFLEFEDR